MKLLHALITLSLIFNQTMYTQGPDSIDTTKNRKLNIHKKDIRHITGSKIHQFKKGLILLGVGIYIGKNYPEEIDSFINKSQDLLKDLCNAGKTFLIDTYTENHLKITDYIQSKSHTSDKVSQVQENESNDHNSKRSDD